VSNISVDDVAAANVMLTKWASELFYRTGPDAGFDGGAASAPPSAAG
jgi:hypothetical protein